MLLIKRTEHYIILRFFLLFFVFFSTYIDRVEFDGIELFSYIVAFYTGRAISSVCIQQIQIGLENRTDLRYNVHFIFSIRQFSRTQRIFPGQSTDMSALVDFIIVIVCIVIVLFKYVVDKRKYK